MTVAIRPVVQRSVSNFQAVATRRRRRGSCRCCTAVNYGGRPGAGSACKSWTPRRLTASRQRITELCEHPSRRATSVIDAPAFSSSIPCRRRRSSSSGLPCGRMSRAYRAKQSMSIIYAHLNNEASPLTELNVRLESQVESLTRALTESRAQQTATAEILRVISSSPTDLQPMAQAIADSASRLCDCTFVGVFRFDGELIHWVAARGASPEQEDALRSVWPRPPGPDTPAGRTILARATCHVHDTASDAAYTGNSLQAARATLMIRSFLGVPMVRDGDRPASLRSPVLRSGRSPNWRSPSSRPSPTRLSLRSRTCACSPSSRRATAS